MARGFVASRSQSLWARVIARTRTQASGSDEPARDDWLPEDLSVFGISASPVFLGVLQAYRRFRTLRAMLSTGSGHVGRWNLKDPRKMEGQGLSEHALNRAGKLPRRTRAGGVEIL